MGYIDRVSKDLFNYKPELTKKEDFDSFWEETLNISKKIPLNSTKCKFDYPSPYVDVFKITYDGFDETKIHGWYLHPKVSNENKTPCLIHYHGFKGNKGVPSDFLHWIMLGIAVISIDCREQGGNTGNNVQYTSGSMQSVVSKGLLDKSQYYYRAVYVDCIRAIDFAYEQCNIDKDKIIVEGASQGGALSMAVSALDDRPLLALADVPSNSNIDKRVESTTGAYKAVSQYLKLHPYETDKVLDTLSYFDTMNMADNIRCKVLASVGLMDNVCPAKYYFATYNRIPGEKDIVIYPFNGHEGGSGNHRELKMRFISDNLK